MKYYEFLNNFKYVGDGVGKDTLIENIDRNELLIGIAVEFEHTTNINISTSIAIDHLTEKNNYYTILLKSGLVDEEKALFLGNKYLNISNDSAQLNAAEDANKQEVDTEDILLGYKPKNIGEEIMNEFGFEMNNGEYVGDKYKDKEGNSYYVDDFTIDGVVLKDKNGNKKEVTTSDLKNMGKY
jgi:hypothetical protein